MKWYYNDKPCNAHSIGLYKQHAQCKPSYTMNEQP